MTHIISTKIDQPIYRFTFERPSKEVLQSVWRNLWQNAGRPHLHNDMEYEMVENRWHICLSGGILQGNDTGRRTTTGGRNSMEITVSAFGKSVSYLHALYFDYRLVGENVEVPLLMAPLPSESETIYQAVFDLLDLHLAAGIAHLDHEMLSSFHPDAYQTAFAKREKEVLQSHVPVACGTSKRRRL